MTTVVEVDGLVKDFRSRGGGDSHRAVDNVSFAVEEGSAFGIVGESGSGKTTVSRILLGLLAPTSGEATVDGVPVTRPSRADRRRLPHLVQVVFQDPYSSMDPKMTVSRIVLEGVRRGLPKNRHAAEAARLLELVGLPAEYAAHPPARLSGGQRQRVAIARALAMNPKVLIADEPVSALDVSMRGQILNLLSQLRESLGLTCILISHDLGVVRQFCDEVVVMSQGAIVESGDPTLIFDAPEHDYTRRLVASVPQLMQGLRP